MRTALRVGSLALFVAVFASLMVNAQHGPGCAGDGAAKQSASEPAVAAPAPVQQAAPAPAPVANKPAVKKPFANPVNANSEPPVHYFPATKAGPVFPIKEAPPPQPAQQVQQQGTP